MKRIATIITFSLLPLISAVGCGSDAPGTGTGGGTNPTIPQPLVQVVAPSKIAAGELLTIFGQGFISDPARGSVRGRFEGTYRTTDGHETQVSLDMTPTVVSQGELQWRFGPNIPFSADDRMGVFQGRVVVENVGANGTSKRGDLTTDLTVGPSIIVRKFQPMNAGCQPGLTETVQNEPFQIEVDAIGLTPGTSEAPIRFVYTFLKENFQFKGFLNDVLGTDPNNLFPESGPVSVVDEVTSGASSTVGSGVRRRQYIHNGAINENGIAILNTYLETYLNNWFDVTQLITAPIREPIATHSDTSVTIMAVDSTGAIARREIPLKIWVPVAVEYQGDKEPIRSFDPELVSACFSGGMVGTQVTYSETRVDVQERRWALSGGASAGTNLLSSIFLPQLEAQLGFEVNSATSSSEATNLVISKNVIAGHFAVFYRQTVELERKADLISHGLCGDTQRLGSVIVTDYEWAADFAQDRRPNCPPAPESNLDPGRVFRQPSQ